MITEAEDNILVRIDKNYKYFLQNVNDNEPKAKGENVTVKSIFRYLRDFMLRKVFMVEFRIQDNGTSLMIESRTLFHLNAMDENDYAPEFVKENVVQGTHSAKIHIYKNLKYFFNTNPRPFSRPY